MSHCPGSEEFPFPFPSDDSKDWSPESPVTSHSRPQRVHSGTQTEGPQLSSAAPEASCHQPSLLVPAAPALTSCPSPVPQRKQRHCAKWENRASIMAKEPEEENKSTYESLESVSVRFSCPPDKIRVLECTTVAVHHSTLVCLSQDNQRLQKANETLRRKLKEAEREVEILKTLLKRHALHPVEEDSSS